MRSHALLATGEAARYMAQLAACWRHEFEVVLGATSARVLLPLGSCAMRAEAEGLNLTVEAPILESLARLEDAVAEQLLRLAFREPDRRLAWTRAWEAGRIDPPTRRVRRAMAI
ncbi:MAG: DUF2218 domain-containing protein [Caulobacter sp.]|nr:DUF2218 domain-containing protein [Caulobacter sp.]